MGWGLLKRIGEGVATGGASEVYRGVTGNDPLDDAKQLGTRALKGAGVIPPDQVQGGPIFAPTEQRASDVFGRAIANSDRFANGPAVTGIREPDQIHAAPVTAQGYVAPEVSAQTMGTRPTIGTRPTDATFVGASPVERYQAALINAPKDVSFNPGDVTVGADKLGPAAQTGASAGQVDSGTAALEGDRARALQIGAAQDIRNSPGAAAAQFKAAMAGIEAAQLGAAGQARGAERAGARREAIIAMGQQGGQAAQAAAAESAREETAKRVAAAGVLGQVRSGDVSTAGFRQQAADLQAQLTAAIAQGNTAAVNQIKQKQADLDLAARTTTAGNTLEAGKTAADVAAGNVARGMQGQEFNAGATTAAAAANAAAGNTRAEQEAARQTALNEGNVTRGLGQEESGLTRGVGQEESGLTRGVDVATGNANREAGALQFGANATNTANTHNSDQSVQVQGQNVTNAQNRDIAQGNQTIGAFTAGAGASNQALGGAVGAGNLGLGAAQGIAGVQTANVNREQAANEALVKNVTTMATLGMGGGIPGIPGAGGGGLTAVAPKDTDDVFSFTSQKQTVAPSAPGAPAPTQQAQTVTPPSGPAQTYQNALSRTAAPAQGAPPPAAAPTQAPPVPAPAPSQTPAQQYGQALTAAPAPSNMASREAAIHAGFANTAAQPPSPAAPAPAAGQPPPPPKPKLEMNMGAQMAAVGQRSLRRQGGAF
jgi:hypothetical protein